MKKETFRAWLKEQETREDVVGSFAKWVSTHSDVPHGHAQYLTWLSYVRNHGAHDRIEHLVKAWEEYEHQGKPKYGP